MRLTVGIDAAHHEKAAALYWQAFGGKLGVVLGPERKAIAFIKSVLSPEHGISAVDDDGRLVGVVGFKTVKGALVDGGFHDMRRIYGFVGATWRSGLLAALERDVENDCFLMDGIFVAEDARGQGIGTALLDAICAEGRRRGYSHIRLDVIDSNTRARALYENYGFEVTKTSQLGLLRWVFGFRTAAAMVCPL